MNKRGLTLIEILFCLAILSIIGASFLKMLLGNTQRLQWSGNLFSAIQVAQKIDQELWEAAQANGTLLELCEEFPEFVSENSLVEGQSPYFRYVFDRKEPFGLIQPEVEQGISPEDGILYEQLKPFQGKVEIRRRGATSAPGHEKHLADAVIQIIWREKDQTTRFYSLPVQIPSPGAAVPLDPLPVDEAILKPAMRDFLFPGHSGRTLEDVAGEKGCDMALTDDVGRLGVIGLKVTEALASVSEEIVALRKEQEKYSSPSCNEVIKPQFTICRKLDKAVSLLFHVLSDMTPRIRQVVAAPQAKLEKIGNNRVREVLCRYHVLTLDFLQRLKKIRVSLAWLGTPAFKRFLSFREQEWTREKLLEVNRLLRSLGEISESDFRAFLECERAIVDGRNPFLTMMYLRNDLLQNDAVRFRQAFPNQVFIRDQIEGEIKPSASEAIILARSLPISPEGDAANASQSARTKQ